MVGLIIQGVLKKMISGFMNHNNKKCLFKLKDFTLEIEEIENRDKVFEEDFKELFSINPKKDETNVLRGKDFNGKEIIFHVSNVRKRTLKSYGCKVFWYIIFNKDESPFDGLQINAEELNWFYNVGNAYDYNYNQKTGQTTVNIKPFESLEKKFSFTFNSTTVNGNLNITRNIKNMDTSPIHLFTSLDLEFEETDDYEKLYQLISILNDFLAFISYRRNISVDSIYLKKRADETGLYDKIGQVFINKDGIFEESEKIIRNRIIQFPLIEENIGNLFNMLVQNKIYLTHIPENSIDRRRITASRFIMITAGFEWQFKLSFKDESKNSEDKYRVQKEELLTFLDEKIEINTGKKKKFFKSYKKFVLNSDMTLEEKINWAFNKFDNVLELFIKDLYSINNLEKPTYGDMAERIAKQRNNYAHGNIDKELNSLVILDLLALEWLNYTMVLNDLGIPGDNIKHVINDLFNRNIAL